MANGYFERGEIYWIKIGDAIGMEESAGRPGLIISADAENNTSPTVVIAYTTKSRARKKDPHSVFTRASLPTETWILCNQIHVMDKSRLTKFVGKLTESEMKEVDDALEEIFDLGYIDDTAIKEKEAEIETLKAEKAELAVEIGTLKAEVEVLRSGNTDALLSMRIEAKMWQKLYERTLDQLVEMKLAADMSSRMAAPAKVPVIEEAVTRPVEPVKSVEVDEEKVDINNCTQTALKKVGFSVPMANLIMSRRPYKAVADLKTVPGMKAKFFRIVEPKLCCTPMPVEPEKVVVVKDAPDPGYEVPRKVNVNTASAPEISEVTGMCVTTAYYITGYRTKNGPYKSLEDLLNVKRFGPLCMKRYGDKMEV